MGVGIEFFVGCGVGGFVGGLLAAWLMARSYRT